MTSPRCHPRIRKHPRPRPANTHAKGSESWHCHRQSKLSSVPRTVIFCPEYWEIAHKGIRIHTYFTYVQIRIFPHDWTASVPLAKRPALRTLTNAAVTLLRRLKPLYVFILGLPAFECLDCRRSAVMPTQLHDLCQLRFFGRFLGLFTGFEPKIGYGKLPRLGL